MRYVLDVRYDGTNYSGWQTQPNAITIQEEVNRVVSMLLRQEVNVYGAGRTDAGVHAMQMPAHFDFEGDLHPAFFPSLNGILPSAISVTKVYRVVLPDFHARFSATSRAYRYNIIFDKDPFAYQRSWWCKEKLDFDAMQRGAEIIKEYKSFESFCKARGNNKTFFCDIRESYWTVEGEMWVYRVKADRFLRGMVRAIVGTLFDMGKGKLDEAGLRKVLEAKDRSQAGGAVTAAGLFLTEVEYPAGSLQEMQFSPEGIEYL